MRISRRTSAALYWAEAILSFTAQQLADNKTLLLELKTAIDGGMPCFAECGGFMYLLEHYRDGDKLYSWLVR